MKRKSIITLLLSVLLIAVVLVGGTLAYLTASADAVVNNFTFAEVDTEIIEPDDGNAVDKAPYVVSNGKSKVFVRARAVVVTQDDSPVPVTEADMTIRYNDEHFNTSTIVNGWENTDGYWESNNDGWYYYTVALDKGDKTEPLFDGVENITVEHNALFDIYVYHESVLAKDGVTNGPSVFTTTP